MTTISVIDSDEPGQTLIEQVEDSGIVARSWAPDTIPVEARLNPDAPPASDMRSGRSGATYTWKMPSAETWQAMGAGTEEQRLAFRDAMIAQGRDVSVEV